MRVTRLLVLICCLSLCGCAVFEYLKPEKPPYEEQLLESYYQTELKQSSSADVLATISRPEYELLSQSKSVVASSGQNKKGHRLWFNMVAFDEDKLTAERKYFFLVDEKGKGWVFWPGRRLVFDCEMVLKPEVLEKPYSNENARRIAVLKQVLENVRKDVGELAQDNKTVSISGMLINQTLETVLHKLDSSPVLASKLSKTGGLDFDHITLGGGNIVMSVADDIVNVEVEISSVVFKREDPFALEE